MAARVKRIAVVLLAAGVAPSTLGDVVAAQGVVTWLLYLAASQLGAGVYMSRRRPVGETYQEDGVVKASVQAAGWGLSLALVGTGYGMKPEFIGFAVFVAGIASSWLTEAVFVVAVQFARSPIQFLRDLRAGRKMREDEEKRP